MKNGYGDVFKEYVKIYYFFFYFEIGNYLLIKLEFKK